MHFRLFRSLSIATGLTFLLSTLAPPEVIPSRVVLIFVAGPFLVFGWMPRFMAAGLTDGFLTSYAGILIPVTLLMGLTIGVFTYEKSNAVIYFLQMLMVASTCLTGIMTLRKSLSSNGSSIAAGAMLGLAYLPMVVLIGLRSTKVRRPEELYRPAACILEYHAVHDTWVAALREAATLPECEGIEKGIEYKSRSSGFTMHTTGKAPVYYTDESGIVRLDGPSGFIVKNYADIVGIIVFRLNEYRQKANEYPPALGTVPDLSSFLRQQQAVFIGYQITYDRESATVFQIHARPTRYGVTGLRSYYADQTGSIRATPLDRAATLNDPVITEQEARGL